MQLWRRCCSPDSTSPISPRRAAIRSNLWFKHGMLFRSAVDAQAPMTAREISETLIAGKTPPPATRKQFKDLQAAIMTALRKRDGAMVVDEGSPARWRLKASM